MSLDHYLIHTVVLERGPSGPADRDAYGEPLALGTLTLPARVEWDNRRVVMPGGEERVCAGMVFLRDWYPDPVSGAVTTLAIGPQDRILFEGRSHPIAVSNRCDAGTWPGDPRSHWEVWIF